MLCTRNQINSKHMEHDIWGKTYFYPMDYEPAIFLQLLLIWCDQKILTGDLFHNSDHLEQSHSWTMEPCLCKEHYNNMSWVIDCIQLCWIKFGNLTVVYPTSYAHSYNLYRELQKYNTGPIFCKLASIFLIFHFIKQDWRKKKLFYIYTHTNIHFWSQKVYICQVQWTR